MPIIPVRERVKASCLLSASVLCLVMAGLAAAGTPPVSVTYYGGAGMVSGSLAEIVTPAGSILLDCGDVIGDDRSGAHDEALPQRVYGARALVVTHAHRDHDGRLPSMVEHGFSGDIYCTSATRTLMGMTLSAQGVGRDRERVWFWSRRKKPGKKPRIAAHWRRECPGLRKMQPANMVFYRGTLDQARGSRAPGLAPCQSCARLENSSFVDRARVCAYGRPVELMSGVRLVLLDAGHIPGSATALFEIQKGSAVVRILFSGDIGPRDSLFQRWDRPAPPADVVFIESTYGGVVKAIDAAREESRFEEALGRVVSERGVAVMPAFALDRSQKALYMVRRARARGLVTADTRIYCPAPRAKEITLWYEQLVRAGLVFRPEVLSAGGIAPDRVRWEWPRDIHGPAVCVVGPGRPAARIARAAIRAGSPVTFFLMGHDAETDGARALPAPYAGIAPAAAEHFEFLSSHADAADAAFWLSAQRRETPVYVVHGDPHRLSAQCAYLAGQGFKNIAAAARGVAIEIP